MAQIQFKAKAVKEILPDPDKETGVLIIYVPELKRSHCDMASFRVHPKFGGFANSDLFPSILKRIKREIAPHGWIRSDSVPDNVSINSAGFLTIVTIDV